VSLGREPNVIGTGDFECATARALEYEAALSVGETEQHGALSDFRRPEHWALRGGWCALVFSGHGGRSRICRRGLLRGNRCEREKQGAKGGLGFRTREF
jgi:hypothetical protein